MTNDDKKNWTFFSNYAHVLLCLNHDPQPTTRQIALRVGITERSVQRIVSELVTSGIVSVTKTGRKNRYTIDFKRRLRHAVESHRTIGEFMNMMGSEILAGK